MNNAKWIVDFQLSTIHFRREFSTKKEAFKNLRKAIGRLTRNNIWNTNASIYSIDSEKNVLKRAV